MMKKPSRGARAGVTSTATRAGGSRTVIWRPTGDELRGLAAAAPRARLTRFGSVNVTTRMTRRVREATAWVSDSRIYRLYGPTLPVADGRRLATAQDRYLARSGAVVIEGYVGAPGPLRLGVRLVTEPSAAPLAAMQRHMLFDPAGTAFTPDLTVISTPDLRGGGSADGAQVAVWLDDGSTRVLGSDFFGETKKAVTRMWAERVYEAGGLVLHACCFTVDTAWGPRSALVAGAPDAGKSTVAFRAAEGGRLVQDDFVALMPGGVVVPSENGCIEKTWNLDPVRQRLLHAAVTSPDAYLENVEQRGTDLFFAEGDRGRDARAVFPLALLGARPDGPLPPLGLFVVLARPTAPQPAVTVLTPVQAAAHFLLREREGGLAEPTGRHGNRLAALLADTAATLVVVRPRPRPPAAEARPPTTTAELVSALAHARHDEAPDLAPDDVDVATAAQEQAYLSSFAGLNADIVTALTPQTVSS